MVLDRKHPHSFCAPLKLSPLAKQWRSPCSYLWDCFSKGTANVVLETRTRALIPKMGDPFSITSSAAGVISLGLTVCHGLLDYYESYKSSGSTVAAMYSQMESLASTLALLNKVLDRDYAQLDSEVARNVEESIDNCRESMEKLEKKLAKIRNLSQADDAGGLRQQLGKHVQKAMFPFKESTLVKLKEVAMELRNDLGLVLGVLQM